MLAARKLLAETGASEGAATTFARDQLTALRVAAEGVARMRVWRRDETGLLLGRFHRAGTCLERISRRHSGGRIVPVGPGVVCITLVVPLVDWLDPNGASLRPDQVLNRALRPLLAALRTLGIDAFYGGRDLVTVGARAIAHASFTVMRDGVGIVEMHVAEEPVFPQLARLLDELDPDRVAGVDRNALADATSIAGLLPPARAGDDEWTDRLARASAEAFGCEIALADAEACADVTMADPGAERALVARPGPPREGARSAAAVSMLGMVECTAGMRGDRITGLEITGDIIAPFHTIDDIAAECEGEPLRPAYVRKALARALARPRSFVLGLRELDELILRLG